MNEDDKETLDRIKGANKAFLIAEKLVESGIHICDGNVISGNGDVYDEGFGKQGSLVFVIYELFYQSDYYEPTFDVEELVDKYGFVFKHKLTSKDALVSMLSE